jgi:hypothetical protein
VDGQLIFDPLFDEALRTQDPALLDICDFRVRSIIFNLLRLFGTVEYVNIGRIAHSLARRPVAGQRRGSVYIVQYKEVGKDYCRVFVIRFQKWGIAEHLDEGKDLLQSIIEASEYADYILDRRLACRQLGMNLPHQVGFGQFTEKYLGHNQYHGTTVRAFYYMRSYIRGIASDKVPPERFRNPAFAHAFATLMGEAAALDMVVGRAATETGECLFDTNYEVLQCGDDGLPVGLELEVQRHIRAVEVPVAVHAGAAAVPAVAQGHDQLVFAFSQQPGNIVGLYGEALVIVPGAGREDKIAHAPPVQTGFIQAVAGDIQHGVLRPLRGEAAAQDGGRLPRFRIVRQLRVDPFGLPDGGHLILNRSHVKTSRLTIWRSVPGS